MITSEISMRRIAALCAFGCVLAGVAIAGEIYGTISDESGKPLADAIVVARGADNKTEVARDTTDEKGAYRLFVRKAGGTRIVLLRDKIEMTGEAVSYPNPVRYNWIVEKSGEKMVLRRQQ